MKNYEVISSSIFITRLVINKILKINEDAGIFPFHSIFGSYIVYSNTEYPSPGKFVVSSEYRNSDEFEQIDVDKDWISVYQDICNSDLNDIGSFFKNIKSLNSKTLEERLRIFMMVHYLSYVGNEFNVSIAKSIVNEEFKLKHNFDSMMILVINFIINLDKKSFVSLARFMNGNDRYGMFVSIINKLVDNDLPTNIRETYGHILSSKVFLSNLLKIVVKLLVNGKSEDFMISVMKNIKD